MGKHRPIEDTVLGRWGIDLETFVNVLHDQGLDSCYDNGSPRGSQVQVELAIKTLLRVNPKGVKESA